MAADKLAPQKLVIVSTEKALRRMVREEGKNPADIIEQALIKVEPQ